MQVVKLMQSLKSRNLVKERYNWRYLYFFLTNEACARLPARLPVAVRRPRTACPTLTDRSIDWPVPRV